MTNREFQSLLDRCAKAAEKHIRLIKEVEQECEARYGVSYSDVDADGIIDVLNYQGGKITVKQFHKEMELHGAERIAF